MNCIQKYTNFKNLDEDLSNQECIFCEKKFRKKEKIFILGCHHLIHDLCLKDQLIIKE